MKKMYCLVVTDDFSRFSWVFFLSTKVESSDILKAFIIGIENLIDLRVKVIRCDNETEFKNRVMNQFCEIKGIKREFSVARTPQQNGAEAVNAACYVQNRVLVIKPHNKTPYELFLGRKPILSFMRPFGCPVTIFNTIDHLVVAGNQSNGNVGTKACDDAGKARMETGEEEKKDVEDPRNESGNLTEGKDSEVPSTEKPRINQEKDDYINSTNNVNAVSSTVNAVVIKVNVVDPKTSIELPNDPNMPELEDIVYSDNDEDVSVEAGMNN
ncbi:putative ribonuclease H-like domain-containing protein [Tanacetum coccineum]|uniref:Ribonuclease H-like domain-containing protein n=1 Tax=Tanacetum coccineum TaxID=301880 RepID=A0ABQ5BNX3_9ASTR